MNNSRKYAEDLVGALNTGHYDTQRTVANQLHKTNWEDLANQYKNLQENLERKRQENNRAFAKGLVNTAESGYDQARANAQNLAQRGLNVSGVQNLAEQANTARKGEQVLGLLSNLGNNMEANAEKLKEATSAMAKKEAQLNADLADTLGDIGASQTSAQMNYNAGLAEIAGQKDARDMENEMARLQREAQAAANARSRSGNDGIDAKIEEAYRNQAIASILKGVDPETGKELEWDDKQKANALSILFNIKDAKDVVSGYNYNANFAENRAKEIEEYEKSVKENAKEYEKAKKEVDSLIRKYGKNNLTLSDENRDKILGRSEKASDEFGIDLRDILGIGKDTLIGSPKNTDEIKAYQEMYDALDEMLANRRSVENMPQMSAIQPASSDMNLAEYLASRSTPEEWEALMDAYATYSDAKRVYDKYNSTDPVYKNSKYKDFNIFFNE